jgi:hypothetical protein
MPAKPKGLRPRRKKGGSKKAAVHTRTKKRVPGRLKGKIWAAPDAFAPMTKKKLAGWGVA